MKENERRKRKERKNAPTETGPLPESHAQDLFVIRVRGNLLTPTKSPLDARPLLVRPLPVRRKKKKKENEGPSAGTHAASFRPLRRRFQERAAQANRSRARAIFEHSTDSMGLKYSFETNCFRIQSFRFRV